MILHQIEDSPTMLVLEHITRVILRSHLSEEEISNYLNTYEIDIEFNDDNQIPEKIKIWIENKDRKYLKVHEVPFQFRKTISELKNDILREDCEEQRKVPIKQKVVRIAHTINQNDQKDGFNYYEELLNDLYSNDPDFPIIKSKLDNLVELLQKVNLEGDEAFEKFENLDFEDEIWDMI